VTDVIYDYLTGLKKMAAEAGFKKGDRLLNITDFPGAAYFLGAEAPGVPWVYGFYLSVFDRMSPADLNNSWILLEPEGPKRTDVFYLEKYGLFPETIFNMVEVGELVSPFSFDGKIYRHFLFKPNSDQSG
jgi:hypothetical protein